MIFDLHNEQDTERQGFTGSMPTGPAKRLGMAFMRGGVNMANTALLAASALREDPGPLFKLHDEIIEPARKYWTPDEPSSSKAMRYLEMFSELPLQLVGGPGTLAASTVMNKAEELVNAGVSPMTAVGVGTVEGAVQAATATIPAAGKTIRQTLMMAGAQPVIGGVASQTSKSILESQGYTEQAKAYDPFDIPARGIELTLGLAFGGLAHYAKAKGSLPVEMVDAIDTAENHQKVKNASPFQDAANPVAADAHVVAYNKALEDLHDGRPVDISPVIRERMENIKTAFGDAEADAMKARGELGTIIEQGDTITDAELDALLQRAYGPYPPFDFKTEPHPEAARLREMVKHETTALAEELAREYPEGTAARIMPPHQDVTPWAMTREELFSARDTTRDWYDNLERSILGDRVKEWRQAVRKGDTLTTDHIESGLKSDEVDALYGVGTKYGSDDFARLADARDTVRAGLELNGYTAKNLAAEIASALYKVGDKKEPGQISPAELEAYAKLDEAFKVIQEQGMNSKAVSDEALKLAAGHFPDPDDALYMLNRFINREQTAARPDTPAPARRTLLEAPQAEGITALPGDQPSAVHISRSETHPEAAISKGTERQPNGMHDTNSVLEADAETLLREHGDMPLVLHGPDGQPVTVSARQLIEEARAAVERTQRLEKAYQRAALCLGLD